MDGVADLLHHGEPVGGVSLLDDRVDGEGGFELGERQLLLQPQQVDAVPQHVQRAHWSICSRSRLSRVSPAFPPGLLKRISQASGSVSGIQVSTSARKSARARP